MKWHQKIIKSLINAELMLPRENGTSVQRNKEIDSNETNNKQGSTSELYDEAICVTNEGNEANTNDKINFTDVTRRKRTHRKIDIIGDSLLKSIESHKMNKCLKSHERIYVKSFPGSTIADIYDHAKPSQRHGNDIYTLHAGSNDLRSKKNPMSSLKK